MRHRGHDAATPGRPPVERALRALTRAGMRRGSGGSTAWLVVLVAVTGVRVARRLGRGGDDVLYRSELRPGDRFLLTVRPPR